MIDRISDIMKRCDVFGIGSFCIPLAVYLLTLAPSVTFFDSGEFVTAVYSLGSAHSPGYPLFINYAKPFTYLPFGSIAFRVNFATAISSACACFGVYLLVSRMLLMDKLTMDDSSTVLLKKICALSASLTFAFSARLWLQSNHDKPYPIVSFLAAIIFYLLLLWREHYRQGEERPAFVYLSAFLCGLGFCAHQTMVLLVPAYAYLVLSVNWRLAGRIKEFILSAACALLGFSVNLHLPIRATQSPLLNWGDAKTLSQFLWHFLRKGYQSEDHARDMALLWDQINAFNIPYEFTQGGFLMLLIGVVFSTAKRRDEVVAYLICIASFLLVIVGYFNALPDLIFLTEEFFTPLYLFSAVFVGLGLFTLLQKTIVIIPMRHRNSLPARVVIILALLALPATVCAVHFAKNDQHENYVAFDYATNSLRSLSQGAVLYTWGDSGAFPLWYLQGVEKMRDDLDILHTPHLVFNWYLDAFPHLFRESVLRKAPLERISPDGILLLSIAEMIDRRPVFIDFSTRYSVELGRYSLEQRGICYRIEKNGGVQILPDLSPWEVYSVRGVSGDMFFRDLDTLKAILIYGYAHVESGETLLRFGRTGAGVAELRKGEQIAPELQGQVVQTLQRFGL